MDIKINVLSLFDGISCGQIALNKLGIKIDNYYASEIEKTSIKVTKHNYPNTIHIGDVREINPDNYKHIDLLIGGSPCQSFSMCGKRNGMTTIDNIDVLTLDNYLKLKQENFKFDGQSYLFWEYVRVLKNVNPKYFLLENVVMEKKWEKIITDTLGVEPIMINSALVSAQSRKRLYWTNIPNVTQPEDKNILVKDIIYDDNYKIFTHERITKTKKRTKSGVQWDMSGKNYKSQSDRAYFKEGKMCTLPSNSPGNKVNIVLDYDNDIYRKLHPIEAERLQTVPDNYTNIDNISDTKRLEILGNGWTVDVIAHIFKNLQK